MGRHPGRVQPQFASESLYILTDAPQRHIVADIERIPETVSFCFSSRPSPAIHLECLGETVPGGWEALCTSRSPTIGIFDGRGKRR
jgi:hypothetical protein